MNKRALSRFTPSLMTPEALEHIFVQRKDLADLLTDRIRETALTPACHNMLLIGPRGIGKTHLVTLIQHRIAAMEDVHQHLKIAWLKEEEWGVASFLDLLLRILKALAEKYQDPALQAKMEALYELDADAAETRAGEILHEFIGQGKLQIIIENLDEIFAGLKTEGQKKLRAYLQERGFCGILATSQALFNGIQDRDLPFYGFFSIEHLSPLSLDESVELLARIANYNEDFDLEEFIRTPTGRARIRAVQHLAGGNHRVYVVFSQFLNRKALDELTGPFMQMLDDLTPYYQARMTYLTPQQRKIVDYLCDVRRAATVKEIASRNFMTHQTASGQLKELRHKGYVVSHAVGRESYYEIREVLMRYCLEVKKNRGEPIQLFVDFLAIWYTKDEIDRILNERIGDAALREAYTKKLISSQSSDNSDPRISACEADLAEYAKVKDTDKALQVLDELIALRTSANDYSVKAICLLVLGRLDEGLKAAEQAYAMEPEDPFVLYTYGSALFENDRSQEAIITFKNVSPPDLDTERLHLFIPALLSYNAPALSLKFIEQLMKLEPNAPASWEYKAQALTELNREEEVFQCFEEAVILGSKNPRLHTDHLKASLTHKDTRYCLQALEKIFEEFGEDKAIIFLTSFITLSNLLPVRSAPLSSNINVDELFKVTAGLLLKQNYDQLLIAVIIRTLISWSATNNDNLEFGRFIGVVENLVQGLERNHPSLSGMSKYIGDTMQVAYELEKTGDTSLLFNLPPEHRSLLEDAYPEHLPPKITN